MVGRETKEGKKICSYCQEPISFSYDKLTVEWQEYDGPIVKKFTKETYHEYLGKQSLDHLKMVKTEQESEEYAKDIFKTGNTSTSSGNQLIGSQEWGQEVVLASLKQRSLIFVTDVLEYLKNKKVKGAIDFANSTLDKLGDYLYDFFKSDDVSEIDKISFKEKIFSVFPESELAKKLK